MNKIKFGFVLTIFIFIVSCQKNNEDQKERISTRAEVAHAWIDQTLKLVKDSPGFSPPVTARTLGYLGIAMYEAGRFSNEGSLTLAGQIQGLTSTMIPQPIIGETYNWNIVVNNAASVLLHACMDGSRPVNKTLIEEYSQNLDAVYNLNAGEKVNERSKIFGIAVGQAIAQYAGTDNQVDCFRSNFPPSYISPKGEGFWVPTSAQIIPLQPYWGEVRSFSANNPNVVVAPSITYSKNVNSDFYKQAKEVYDVSKNLTLRERTIAEFWSDDPGKSATPPGHSISIAKISLKKQNSNFITSLETYAKVGMGLHDAFVSCWKTKYKYNLLRPVTYIREMFDPRWNTILPTPPFPEYTSGHSVQSGAAAEILESVFGTNFAFQDDTHAERTDINGTPRNFVSFEDFANEAASSRLYGGIHYIQAIFEGVKEGREIGKNINKLKFK